MHRPLGRPWVIAHRGGPQVAPENTVAAFREARASGADAVELDVRRTSDGVLVVHHDPVVKGVGAIVETERAELRRAAPSVPDFEEAMAACEGMWVNVEIKNTFGEPDWDPDRTVAARVAAWLHEAGLARRAVVSSFDLETATTAARSLPGLKSGWLTGSAVDPLPTVATTAAGGLWSLHPRADTLAGPTAARVAEAAHTAGLAVIPWTVDDPKEMIRLAAAGIDGIITNHPALALSILEHGHCDRG